MLRQLHVCSCVYAVIVTIKITNIKGKDNILYNGSMQSIQLLDI